MKTILTFHSQFLDIYAAYNLNPEVVIVNTIYQMAK